MTSPKTNTINSCSKNAALDSKAAQRATQVEEMSEQLTSEISLRKSLEKSQLNGHQEWKATFDTLKEPIIILDNEYEVVNGNDAAYELLSIGHEDILGRKCYQLFVGSPSPCTDCPLEIVKLSGKRHEVEVERPFLDKILRVACAPLFHGAEPVGYILSAVDISHQRNLEKQLVQAQKMEAIATLAGGIAHDFNNILGTILGNADLLLYRLPDSFSEKTSGDGQLSVEDIEEHLAAIKKASLRAKDLVSQILAFSRQTTTRSKNVIITPVVKEAVKLLQASLPATIELHAELVGNIGYIYADPTQVHQVLMNLCTNAVNALENQHGRINIYLHETRITPGGDKPSIDLKYGEYVVLSVRDNGIGMTDNVKERIFEPFFTTREVGAGTGMGLAVLHGIVTAHNGVIDVSSEPGKGSVFKVYFPKIKVRENIENNHVTSLPTGSETIIFADDEEDIVKMHTRMLEYLGYTVIPAASGEQVLSYLENHLQEVDLIITDQTMPKMTGLELAKKIHAIRKDLPIILCSGYSDTLSSKTSQPPRINNFLAKPIKMKDLAVTIRRVFSEIK